MMSVACGHIHHSMQSTPRTMPPQDSQRHKPLLAGDMRASCKHAGDAPCPQPASGSTDAAHGLRTAGAQAAVLGDEAFQAQADEFRNKLKAGLTVGGVQYKAEDWQVFAVSRNGKLTAHVVYCGVEPKIHFYSIREAVLYAFKHLVQDDEEQAIGVQMRLTATTTAVGSEHRDITVSTEVDSVQQRLHVRRTKQSLGGIKRDKVDKSKACSSQAAQPRPHEAQHAQANHPQPEELQHEDSEDAAMQDVANILSSMLPAQGGDMDMKNVMRGVSADVTGIVAQHLCDTSSTTPMQTDNSPELMPTDRQLQPSKNIPMNSGHKGAALGIVASTEPTHLQAGLSSKAVADAQACKPIKHVTWADDKAPDNTVPQRHAAKAGSKAPDRADPERAAAQAVSTLLRTSNNRDGTAAGTHNMPSEPPPKKRKVSKPAPSVAVDASVAVSVPAAKMSSGAPPASVSHLPREQCKQTSTPPSAPISRLPPPHTHPHGHSTLRNLAARVKVESSSAQPDKQHHVGSTTGTGMAAAITSGMSMTNATATVEQPGVSMSTATQCEPPLVTHSLAAASSQQVQNTDTGPGRIQRATEQPVQPVGKKTQQGGAKRSFCHLM